MSASISTVLATAFLAGALALPGVGPAGRIGEFTRDPKAPRDGPGNTSRWGKQQKRWDKHRIASDIELFAACFRAGLPAAAAAAAVAESYQQGGQDEARNEGENVGDTGESGQLAQLGQLWRRVVAYSELGIEPERAWAVMHGVPGCEELASTVTLSHASGSAVADSCDRIAESLRADAADDATAAAERAGVLISIPLAAFFLPAFFVLGLAPVVIGLGSDMFGGG